MTNEPTTRLDARKSLKVKLPLHQHIRLHAMRLFSEGGISDTVEAALSHYFDHLEAEGKMPEGLELPTGVPAS